MSAIPNSKSGSAESLAARRFNKITSKIAEKSQTLSEFGTADKMFLVTIIISFF
jgi:hypothetical protein